MVGIIYRYKSPRGKCYIGQTVEENKRRRLFNNLNQSYGGVKIDNARKKYGPKNFEYTVLIKVESDNCNELKDYLNILEIGFIRIYDSYNSGYNSTLGGKSLAGFHPSKESRKKMSDSHLGKRRSYESRVKQSKNGRGRKLSEETKQKMSESKKGLKFSIEHCKNIGKSKKGVHLSEETKRKISESKKGKISHPITSEMRLKLSKINMGKKDSDETKKKKSESARIAWEKRKIINKDI